MKTDKHKLQAALVRSFFDAFSSGVIDCERDLSRNADSRKT